MSFRGSVGNIPFHSPKNFTSSSNVMFWCKFLSRIFRNLFKKNKNNFLTFAYFLPVFHTHTWTSSLRYVLTTNYRNLSGQNLAKRDKSDLSVTHYLKSYMRQVSWACFCWLKELIWNLNLCFAILKEIAAVFNVALARNLFREKGSGRGRG